MQTTTIRPGLLVSLKTSLRGGVNYQVQVIEGSHLESDGTQKEVWETAKTVYDPAEHAEAIKVRGKACSLVKSVCANGGDFGLLCRQSREEELDQAIDEGRALVREFNRNANYTRIVVNVVVGRFESDDARAIRSINSEVSDLLATMEDGIQKLDADAVRKAAARAKSIGQMLSPDAGAQLKEAISAARKAASRIIKFGDDAASQIDESAIKALTAARTSFLDLSDVESLPEAPAPVAEAQLVGEPDGPAIAVDLDLDANEEEGINEDDPDQLPAFLKRDWNKKRVTLDVD